MLGTMAHRYVTDQQEVLAEMAREGSENRTPSALLASPGVAAPLWPVKVKSHVDYNVYSVRRVIIEDAGVSPTEFDQELEATNLAESFTSQGTLSAGTHAIMFRTGEKNVFYAVP